jgi:hypothetical protein
MALVVPDEGEIALLKAALNHTAVGNVKLHLYHSDITITENTVFADANAAECDEAGYAVKILTGSSWTVAEGAGDLVTAEYAAQLFTFAETATVYGYYVTNNANDKLLWIEEFSTGPYVLPADGGNISVTPKFSAA